MEKNTLVAKNKKKVLKPRLWRAGSIDIIEFDKNVDVPDTPLYLRSSLLGQALTVVKSIQLAPSLPGKSGGRNSNAV